MIKSLKIKKSLLLIAVLSICLVPNSYSQSQNFSQGFENQIQGALNNHLQNLQEKTHEEQKAILETMNPKHIELMTKYVHPETIEGTLIEEKIYKMTSNKERFLYNHKNDDDTRFDINPQNLLASEYLLFYFCPYEYICPNDGPIPIPTRIFDKPDLPDHQLVSTPENQAQRFSDEQFDFNDDPSNVYYTTH